MCMYVCMYVHVCMYVCMYVCACCTLDMTSLPVLESVRDEVTASLDGLAHVLVRHDNRFMAKQVSLK